MTRVALYARVSTDDREQDPETQLHELREAGALAGDVVRLDVDQASAGDLRRRTAWGALIDACARRQVDLVLVWRLDRAFRSVLHGATTLEQLRSWGVGLRSLREPWIDTTTPMGEALFHIATAFA